MATVTVWVLVDECGDYVVSTDKDTLKEKWDDEIGNELISSRVLKVALEVELPTVMEAAVVVPEKAGAMKVKVTG